MSCGGRQLRSLSPWKNATGTDTAARCEPVDRRAGDIAASSFGIRCDQAVEVTGSRICRVFGERLEILFRRDEAVQYLRAG